MNKIYYLIAFTVLFVTSCMSSNKLHSDNTARAEISHVPSYYELTGVRFKPNRPVVSDTIDTALAEPISLNVKNLEWDAQLLINNSNEIAEINGYSDNMECQDSECEELSLRRAKMIYAWLLQRGVSKNQLKMPRGFGNKSPISFNNTEDGRANNRRVEVNLL